MANRIWIIVLLSAGFVAVGSLWWMPSGVAPIGNARILVRIPFEFRIGETLLPAGEYTLERLTSGVLQVRSITIERGAIISERLVKLVSHDERMRIVFNQDRGDYFLSEVYWPVDDPRHRNNKTKLVTVAPPEVATVASIRPIRAHDLFKRDPRLLR